MSHRQGQRVFESVVHLSLHCLFGCVQYLRTMADNQEQTLEQARKEVVQGKLLQEVIDVLRSNREALCHLPEMLQQLIDMPEAIAKVEKVAEHPLGECSNRSEKDKAIIAQRDKEDLEKKVKFLLEDNDVKAKRIITLEKIIQDHKAEIAAVRNTQSASMSKDESLGEKDKNLKELTKTLRARNSDLIQDIATKEAELKEQANRIASLEKGLQETDERKVEVEERFHQLQEVHKTAVSNKEREIDQLKNRLATLSEKRVRQDQSKVEDTLSLNRQSKVEEDFAKFIDEARIDVIERFQTLCKPKEKIYAEIYYPRLACLIFEAAYERMNEAREAAVEFLKEAARGVVYLTPEQSRVYSLNEKGGFPFFKVSLSINVRRKESNYPVDVLDALMLSLKETAPTCNLDCFLDDVKHVAWCKWNEWQKEDRNFQLSPNANILNDQTVVMYMKECIRLTWKIVTQIPPMQIEHTSLFLQNIHTRIGYHNSPDMLTKAMGPSGQHQREEIACYLWPGLWDGGGRLIRAGEVLCKIKDKL